MKLKKSKKTSSLRLKAKKSKKIFRAGGWKKLSKPPQIKKEKFSIPAKGKALKKAKAEQEKVENLLKKGRLRGFITHSEILKEFPFIEENIVFLDELYARFQESGMYIVAGKGLLES